MRSIRQTNTVCAPPWRGGCPCPESILVDSETDLSSLKLSFPVIVKPIDRSGSRGVEKVDSKDRLGQAVASACAAGFEKKALIEEYVYGQEYSVEGISYRGDHEILAVTLKYTTGEPHFIETGHMEPAPIDDGLRERVICVVIRALNALGIENGASHSEIKIDEGGDIKIIEIGSRMGGDAIGSDLVPLTTGIDYVRAVIQVACGEKPDLSVNGQPCQAEVRFILNQGDLCEFLRLNTEESGRILSVVDGVHEDRIGNTTNSGDRAGCYIVRI